MGRILPFRLYLGGLVSVLLVILIGVLSLYTLKRQEEEENLVNRTFRVLSETEAIRNTVFVIETSRRGFRSTNERVFLAPYFETSPKILSRVEKLASLVSDNSKQVKRVNDLSNRIKRLLAFYARLGTNPASYSISQKVEITKEEKVLVGSILSQIDEIVSAEKSLLSYRESKNKALRKNTEVVIQIGTFLILILVCVLVLVVLQEFKSKIKAYEKKQEESQLKSRFVSMASHEFRTPLSSVQLSASLIEKYLNLSDHRKILKHTAKIKSSVENLTGILNEFLSLDRLETGKISVDKTEFDLVELCQSIKEDMESIAKAGQTLVYNHKGSNTNVSLDKNLLKNCIINLVSNAIKYSGPDTIISINSAINSSGCSITVKDNGIGIPEEDQKKLFEPFFRAGNTSNVSGTGLGLNIVLRYVGLMEGKVSFASKQNAGSTFVLDFPAQKINLL